MQLVHELARWLSPWQTLYSDSTAVSATVTTLHIVALLLSGGLAIAADRTTLRTLRLPAGDRAHPLQELRAVHRPVLLALSVLVASGVLLAAADVNTFATSALFWIKLGLVGLLLINGAGLFRTESRLLAARAAGVEPAEKLWRRLGRRARLSLVLWLVTAVAGTVLTNVS